LPIAYCRFGDWIEEGRSIGVTGIVEKADKIVVVTVYTFFF
jgi:hypothetical protein